MIKSIAVKNFMAHRDTQLELSPGVTVITGPNNVGKSAVVEAVRSLATNHSPKYVIRHGAPEAVVSLELDSGEVIRWHRTKNSAYYTILRPPDSKDRGVWREEHYRKLGREVPADVRELLRLNPVETEGDTVDIHIGNQREPIFLLNRPGSQAAAFFAASTEADYLVRMRQALKQRADFASKTRKRLLAECAHLEKVLACYAPLVGWEERLKEAEDLYDQIVSLQSDLPRLAEILADLEKSGRQWQAARNLSATLEALRLPPELQETEPLKVLLGELHLTGRRWQREQAASRALAALSAAPVLAETTGLESLAVEIETVQDRLATTQERKKVLAGLATPPEPLEVAGLRQVWEEMVACARQVALLEEQRQVLDGLTATPELHDLRAAAILGEEMAAAERRREELTKLTQVLAGLKEVPDPIPLADLEQLIQQLKAGEEALAQEEDRRRRQEEALAAKKAEVAAFIQDTGLCPLCGSPLDVDHFLEGGHG